MEIINITQLKNILCMNSYDKPEHSIKTIDINDKLSILQQNIKIREIKTIKLTYNPKIYMDNLKYGVYCENVILNKLNINNIVKGRQKAYSYTTGKVKLIARVDGFYKNKLIELKTRIYKFKGIQPVDILQLQMYMFVLGLKSSYFLEAYNNKIIWSKMLYNKGYTALILDSLNGLYG